MAIGMETVKVKVKPKELRLAIHLAIRLEQGMGLAKVTYN
jgi:hypothetical protein